MARPLTTKTFNINNVPDWYLAMTSVGQTLRTEREMQERGMATIAAELCIPLRYVLAIEQDDLRSLPGSFFYKSFVKQYATILGVDQVQLLPGIEALTAATEPLPLPGADPRYDVPKLRRPNHDHLSMRRR
jgi:cytoskeletal protein RodZ